MTRQRLWQLKMNAAGRCAICGKSPLKTRQHCAQHAKKASKRALPKHIARYHADPAKPRARNALNRAIRKGLITRPDTCTQCGARDTKINGHHHDYSKPFEVEWLCYRCHFLRA